MQSELPNQLCTYYRMLRKMVTICGGWSTSVNQLTVTSASTCWLGLARKGCVVSVSTLSVLSSGSCVTQRKNRTGIEFQVTDIPDILRIVYYLRLKVPQTFWEYKCPPCWDGKGIGKTYTGVPFKGRRWGLAAGSKPRQNGQ